MFLPHNFGTPCIPPEGNVEKGSELEKLNKNAKKSVYAFMEMTANTSKIYLGRVVMVQLEIIQYINLFQNRQLFSIAPWLLLTDTVTYIRFLLRIVIILNYISIVVWDTCAS